MGTGPAARLLGITVKTPQRWKPSPTAGFPAQPSARIWPTSGACWNSLPARGVAGVEFVEEVGDGLDFGRKRFLALMDAIGRGELATLVLAHRDRLTRFGFDWFAHYAALHGCELLVLNQEHPSPEQAMVQDLMTIVYGFSSRLCGLRNYRRQLRAALASNHAAGAPDQD